ncbi:hypothetical protein GEV33_002153 [Tenebrio molitor]|uniref:Uncharacterized protein n=1 Tax=Tenebrio molitor TaxID=7067 RepID=A0A8J6HW54_TENMO|nr:hypothetical protein GEV33_002153 [Tenebrio molitor]
MCTETVVPTYIESMPHKDRGKQLQQYEIRISSNGDYATRQKSEVAISRVRVYDAPPGTMNDMLEDIRQAQKPKTTRKKKLQVEPSKSVSSVDLIFDENEQSPSTSKTHTKTKKRKRVEEQTKTDEDDNENSYESETEQDQDNLFEELDHENTKPAESFSSNHTQVRKSDKYYLGQVLGIDDDPHCDKGVFRVNFMRPNRKMRNTFVFPVKADIADVEKEVQNTCVSHHDHTPLKQEPRNETTNESTLQAASCIQLISESVLPTINNANMPTMPTSRNRILLPSLYSL